ncbi:MAG: glycosyltransferase family 2 protein [Candidatus Schekmanbacteria bacterium]|nr:glycosyltransferase family 2 protein [Candidatus Schekmanbacteria bacterium]
MSFSEKYHPIMLKISAIVCTFNRSALLRQALQSLVEQTLGKEYYEVLVIDNASTDNTKAVIKEFLRYKNFRYIYEPKQGLSHSRNTGYKNAEGVYVTYLDDDARASADWLERIVATFETVKPETVAVGGKILPWYEQAPPSWFVDDYETFAYGPEKGFIQSQYGFGGSNMTFRKAILELYGGFPIEFGMCGGKMGFGDETLLFREIYKQHPWFWYDPEITVEHWVPKHKMTIRYRLKRSYSTGITAAKSGAEYVEHSIIKTVLYIVKDSISLLFSVKWREKNWQRAFIERAQPIAHYAGALRVLMGNF